MTTIETCRTTSELSESMSRPSSGTPTSRPASEAAVAMGQTPGGNQLPREANDTANPKIEPPLGDLNSTVDQRGRELPEPAVGGGLNSRQANESPDSKRSTPAGADAGTDQTAIGLPATRVHSLFDPFLALAAEVLDDAEKNWIANANRLRQLTRTEADSDGEKRGFGLDESHPDVARLAAMVNVLEQLTKDATKNLEKVIRRHPLHPWIKAQRGLGDKQVARLLAAIGDPYWNTLYDRPRTVSELRAYCGLHVLPAGQVPDAAHQNSASGVSTSGSDTGHHHPAAQESGAGVAPRRQRGRKSNWNEDARKRAWLISQSVVKSGGPYREIYDATKAKYADAVHATPCIRCGPAGRPAPAGSPLSKAHINARGHRAIMRAVVEDLWAEAKRLHETP